MITNADVTNRLELLTDGELEDATGGRVEMWSTEPVPPAAADDCEAPELA